MSNVERVSNRNSGSVLMDINAALDFCWAHGARVEFIHVQGHRRVVIKVARYLQVERYTFEDAVKAMQDRIESWLRSGRTYEEM